MKTLLVATFVDFWTEGSGHRSRISGLLGYLQSRVHITVFFAGSLEDRDRVVLAERFPFVAVEGACPSGPLSYGEYAERFRDFVQGRSFDFVLVEYIELSSVLEYLPEHTVTLLDTHDLVADRIGSFHQAGLAYDGIELTLEEELDIFGCYDYIVLIQQNEIESISRFMDRERLVLTPHPVRGSFRQVRSQVRNIGFVASPYLPNVEALNWFLREVWGALGQRGGLSGCGGLSDCGGLNDCGGLCERGGLTLNVYGNVSDAFPSCRIPNIRWHGFVPDVEQVYRDCEIIINPVRCGAGLKIKNVEALAHGLPLVTTTHGSAGMEDGRSSCFLQADSAREFGLAIERLIDDAAFRETLAENAFAYARSHFSEETCYGPITNLIT